MKTEGKRRMELGLRPEILELIKQQEKDQCRETHDLVLPLLVAGNCVVLSGKDDTLGVFALCNDLFYWACADLEQVATHEDAVYLFAHWVQDPISGPEVWACKKRNLQPQEPVLEQMEKQWSVVLLTLPRP